MMDTNDHDLLRDAIHWLARLPFLGLTEMAMLLRLDEARAQAILSELEGLGWCEWIAPTSPELPERRLYVLTQPAQDRLVQSKPPEPLPLSRRETLARLPRLETTAGFNRFISELVAAIAQDIEVDLADARSLPWTMPRATRYWPPEVEGYLCLRWRKSAAPFFVAWDRAAAAPIHRRKRVAAWYTYSEAQRRQTPPIFIICPGEREIHQWARAVLNSADRRKCPLIAVSLTTASMALTDPLGAIWRGVDRHALDGLCFRMPWVPREALTIEPLETRATDIDTLPASQEPLRRSLIQAWSDRAAMSGAEWLAAVSLAAGSLEKTALEWIAHHTLLTPSDIATLMDIPIPLAEKLASRLGGHGLVTELSRLGVGESEPDRCILTSLGLRLLAARDGVPPQRYVRHGVVAGPDPGQKSQRLDTLVSQFEHTVGTNSFFVRLTRDLRARGGRLLRWMNASESAERFWYRGQRRWLRPDGYAEFAFGGEFHRIFLEWDRGTNRHAAHLKAKLQHYADYFAARSSDEPPDLVVVTVSPTRETVIWKTLAAVFVHVPTDGVYTTTDSLLERAGPLSAIWRRGKSSVRSAWVGSGAPPRTDQVRTPDVPSRPPIH